MRRKCVLNMYIYSYCICPLVSTMSMFVSSSSKCSYVHLCVINVYFPVRLGSRERERGGRGLTGPNRVYDEKHIRRSKSIKNCGCKNERGEETTATSTTSTASTTTTTTTTWTDRLSAQLLSVAKMMERLLAENQSLLTSLLWSFTSL